MKYLVKMKRYLSYKEIQTIRKEIKRLEKRLNWLDTGNYFERRDFIEDLKKVEYIKEILEERHGRTRALVR